MSKIKIVLENVSEEQAAQIQRDMAHIPSVKVTTSQVPIPIEQVDLEKYCHQFDPGPAIGDTFTVDHIQRGKAWMERELVEEIDMDEKPTVSRLYAQIRDALETIVDRYSDLEAQLEAEGAHTEAANAEIEGLRGRLEASIASNEKMLDRINELNRLLDGKTQST